jgi:hypothetical protein
MKVLEMASASRHPGRDFLLHVAGGAAGTVSLERFEEFLDKALARGPMTMPDGRTYRLRTGREVAGKAT